MRQTIFDAAVVVARRVGYRNVNRKLIAKELGRSEAWVTIEAEGLPSILREITARAPELDLQPGKRQANTSGIWKQHDRGQIVEVAYAHAKSHGYGAVIRTTIARLSGFSTGTLSNYFGGTEGLRDEVMRRAVAESHIGLIVQGLSAGNPIAREASAALQEAAIATLLV